jgi:hypothetical protein
MARGRGRGLSSARARRGRSADASRTGSTRSISELREAGGLGLYLGGRIRIFPHQLYVAERATQTDPVR